MPPLKGTALKNRLRGLGHAWKAVRAHHLEKEYTFKNFRDALAFTNRVATVAEEQGHHPDLYLGWGKVRVTLCTHKVDGLTENDFTLAARIEQLEIT